MLAMWFYCDNKIVIAKVQFDFIASKDMFLMVASEKRSAMEKVVSDRFAISLYPHQIQFCYQNLLLQIQMFSSFFL